MITNKNAKSQFIAIYIATMDREGTISRQPELLKLLDSVQLPADLTDATKPDFDAMISGVGEINEYSLKCLILLEKNLINQTQCNKLCRFFDDIARRISVSTWAAPQKGPANDAKW